MQTPRNTRNQNLSGPGIQASKMNIFKGILAIKTHSFSFCTLLLKLRLSVYQLELLRIRRCWLAARGRRASPTSKPRAAAATRSRCAARKSAGDRCTTACTAARPAAPRASASVNMVAHLRTLTRPTPSTRRTATTIPVKNSSTTRWLHLLLP